MKKNLFFAFLLLILGCGCAWQAGAKNIANSRNLRVGMTKSEVLKIMGEPLRNEEFNQPDLWFYYVHCNWYDGFTTEDECMPLVFEKGRLVGWGNAYYAQMRYDRHHSAAQWTEKSDEKKQDLKKNTLFPQK